MNQQRMIGTLVLAGVALVALLILGGMKVSLDNQDARFRNQLTMEQQKMGNIYDNTWKTISQEAQITDKYKDDFKDVFVNIMNARYKTGGEMFKAVNEATGNTLDSSIYHKLMDVVEASRAQFTDVQNEAAAIKQQHDNLLDTWPGNFFLRGRPHFDLKFVTSARTQEAFNNGEDNVDVFDKKK